MNETERNLRIAQTFQSGFDWDGRPVRDGDLVALLDGRVVAVADTADAAIAALRALDPDPRRGMVIEVAPPTIDVIRQGR
jgi:hypothetical protein